MEDGLQSTGVEYRHMVALRLAWLYQWSNSDDLLLFAISSFRLFCLPTVSFFFLTSQCVVDELQYYTVV